MLYAQKKKQKGKTKKEIKRGNFTMTMIYFFFPYVFFYAAEFHIHQGYKEVFCHVSLGCSPIFSRKNINLTNTMFVGLSFIRDSVNFRTNCI